MDNSFKIKNIIFDLGGVLINLNKNKTLDCFGANISPLFSAEMNKDFINLMYTFECGEITASKFRKEVCRIFNLVISSETFDECWNAMIDTMPTNRINMLLQLRKKYRIFALSNTNEIHNKYFTNQDYWEPKIFENVYFSNILGMRKPNLNIFDFVLNQNNLKPEETLYVDDNIENVKAAEEIGLFSVLVDEEIEDILDKILR